MPASSAQAAAHAEGRAGGGQAQRCRAGAAGQRDSGKHEARASLPWGRSLSRRTAPVLLSMRMPNPMHPRAARRVLNDRAWPRRATGSGSRRRKPGFERLEAFFAGHGYEPHRHDTYAIGVTLSRRAVVRLPRRDRAQPAPARPSSLHPDEVHDGRAGTDAGFRYRIAYIEPRLMQEALGEPRRPLPFARDACHRRCAADRRHRAGAARTSRRRWRICSVDQVLAGVAAALGRGRSVNGGPMHDRRGLLPSRCRRRATFSTPTSSTWSGRRQLEAITGLSRFALARHFRACLGTSPYRYLVMRRLDRARHLHAVGRVAGRGGGRERLCRSEPHDPPVQESLWPLARPLAARR